MTLLGKLIKVAHDNPETRADLMPIIKEAMEHKSPDALKKYLHEHPKADKAKHHVQKPGGSGSSEKVEGPKDEKPSEESSGAKPKRTDKVSPKVQHEVGGVFQQVRRRYAKDKVLSGFITEVLEGSVSFGQVQKVMKHVVKKRDAAKKKMDKPGFDSEHNMKDRTVSNDYELFVDDLIPALTKMEKSVSPSGNAKPAPKKDEKKPAEKTPAKSKKDDKKPAPKKLTPDSIDSLEFTTEGKSQAKKLITDHIKNQVYPGVDVPQAKIDKTVKYFTDEPINEYWFQENMKEFLKNPNKFFFIDPKDQKKKDDKKPADKPKKDEKKPSGGSVGGKLWEGKGRDLKYDKAPHEFAGVDKKMSVSKLPSDVKQAIKDGTIHSVDVGSGVVDDFKVPDNLKKSLFLINSGGKTYLANPEGAAFTKYLLEVTGVGQSKGKDKKPADKKAPAKSKYNKKVQTILTKNDLVDDDADEVKSFKKKKPTKGQTVSDAELMRRFLSKAKPETKERMKGMSPADFMKILGAITDDEEGDGGKQASMIEALKKVAAEYPKTRVHLIPVIKEAMEHKSPDALKKYLHEHPKADKSKHHVKKPGGKSKTEAPKEDSSKKDEKPAEGGKKDPKQPIKVDKRLGELLGQWHSSGSDPIYAVSSHAMGGHEVPRETIQKALSKVNNLINYPDAYHVDKAGKKQLQKAKSILDSMLK